MQAGENTNKSEQPKNNGAGQGTGKQQDADEIVKAAHQQAEADIEQDPDLNSAPDPTADLDEGEIARLDNGNDEKVNI